MRTVASTSLPAYRSSVFGVCVATRHSTQLHTRARGQRLTVHAAQLDSETKRVLQESVQSKLGELRRELSMMESRRAAIPPQIRQQLRQILAWCRTDEGRRQLDLLREDPELTGMVEIENITELDILFTRTNSRRVSEKIFRMLQEHCFPNLLTVGFESILDAARYDEHKLVIEFLEAGDDPNCVDDENRSPLHLAALAGGILVTDILLEAGADFNARDSNGDTPLHVAARGCEVMVAVQLLVAGADGAIKNKNGRTPGDVIREHNPSYISGAEGFLSLLDRLASP